MSGSSYRDPRSGWYVCCYCEAFDLDLVTLDLDGVVKDSKASPAFNFTEKLNI